MRCRLLLSLFGGLVFLFWKFGALLLNARCKVCMLADGVEAFGVHFAE